MIKIKTNKPKWLYSQKELTHLKKHLDIKVNHYVSNFYKATNNPYNKPGEIDTTLGRKALKMAKNSLKLGFWVRIIVATINVLFGINFLIYYRTIIEKQRSFMTKSTHSCNNSDFINQFNKENRYSKLNLIQRILGKKKLSYEKIMYKLLKKIENIDKWLNIINSIIFIPIIGNREILNTFELKRKALNGKIIL